MIKKIKDTFTKNDFDYRLIARVGRIALFEQFDAKEVCGYEIHKIRVKPIQPMFLPGDEYKGYTHYEKLPSNEEFGKYGWYYMNKRLAIDHYNELIKKEKKKEFTS